MAAMKCGRCDHTWAPVAVQARVSAVHRLAEKVNFSPNKRCGSNAPAKPQIPGGLELTVTGDTKPGVQSHQGATNREGQTEACRVTDKPESGEKFFLEDLLCLSLRLSW